MKNFIIWFHHRSGSTHLTSLLNSHPQIVCYLELFFRGETVDHDPFTAFGGTEEAFLDRLFQLRYFPHGKRPKGTPSVVGFKLKDVQVVRYPKVWDYMLGRREQIHVLHLVRENLLASLTSHALLPTLFQKYQNANIGVHDSTDGLNRSVKLNPETLLSRLDQLQQNLDTNREMIASFPHKMEISYELLIQEPATALQKILFFLEVDTEVTLHSDYQKILPTQLSQVIVNSDDIYQVLQDTPYLKFWS